MAQYRVGYSHKADLFVFPYVSATASEDTFISFTNDDTVARRIHLQYVDGVRQANTSPNCGGWLNLDRTLNLTGNQPSYFSARSGSGGLTNVGSFKDLGGGADTRGFILAWTVDENNVPVGTNQIAASATIVNYTEESSWEYKPWGFRSNFTGPLGNAGEVTELLMDGWDYQKNPSHLLLDFWATGANDAFGAGTTTDFELTLLPMHIDLRALPDFDEDGTVGELPLPGGTSEDCSPPTTAVTVLSWNEHESQVSNTVRCLTCWDSTLGSAYGFNGAASPFALGTLQTKKGKARLNGSTDVRCNQAAGSANSQMLIYEKRSIDMAILGVCNKKINFSGGGVSRANSALTAMGERTDGFIKFDAADQGTPPTLSSGTGSGAVGDVGGSVSPLPVRAVRSR
jgi:hypothetical protein